MGLFFANSNYRGLLINLIAKDFIILMYYFVPRSLDLDLGFRFLSFRSV
jgi:hypothetical protein